jgi:hypothetical protein
MQKNILLVVLAVVTFYSASSVSRHKLIIEKQQLLLHQTQDTLRYFWHNRMDWVSPGVQKILGLRQLDLGDSLLEAHRIVWITNRVYCINLQVRCDSTVRLIYRSGRTQNPLTKEGRDTIFFQQTKLLGSEIWDDFRQKLAGINFLDATRSTQYLCCYTTGSLDWEAQYLDRTRRSHHVWCRQSTQFAAACESLFKHCNDPNLQSRIERAIE